MKYHDISIDGENLNNKAVAAELRIITGTTRTISDYYGNGLNDDLPISLFGDSEGVDGTNEWSIGLNAYELKIIKWGGTVV